jgi:hypothetical protein
MIYILAAPLPPIGLLLNGQPISAIFSLIRHREVVEAIRRHGPPPYPR